MPPKAKETLPSGVASLNAQLDSAILVVDYFRDFTNGIYLKADSRSMRTAVSVREVAEKPAASTEVKAAVSAVIPTATPASTTSTTTATATATATETSPPETVDALALAGDAARLVRAHATKISLLIINEPYTPSAISQEVQRMTSGPVVSLAQAAEICHSSRYTRRIRRDLALRCGRVLTQLLALLKAVPRDGRVVPEAQRGSTGTGTGTGGGRGSFAQVGILWAECDDLAAFAQLGVQGRLIQIVEQLADTLSDELDELKEWGEEGSDEDDDDGFGDDDDAAEDDGDGDDDDDDDNKDGNDTANPHAATQALLDQLMSAGGHISATDPTRMRPRLELVLKKMRLVILLCRAVIKRRLRTPTLPALPARAATDCTLRLDNGLAVLQRIPDRFGDLAAAFYDMNVADVDATMLRCFEDAFMAAEIWARPWTASLGGGRSTGDGNGDGDGDGNGDRDAFTKWAAQFQAEMRTTLNVDN